jgi:hypothetical protein
MNRIKIGWSPLDAFSPTANDGNGCYSRAIWETSRLAKADFRKLMARYAGIGLKGGKIAAVRVVYEDERPYARPE